MNTPATPDRVTASTSSPSSANPAAVGEGEGAAFERAVRRLEEITRMPREKVTPALAAALRSARAELGSGTEDELLDAAVKRAVVTLWAEMMRASGRLIGS